MSATVLQIGPTRTCSRCGENKTVNCFSPSTRIKSGFLRMCKTCVNVRQSAWVHARLEDHNLKSKNRSYKIDFNALWEKQGGLCAVCQGVMVPKGKTAKSVVVDHDQKCCPGKGSCGQCVRGLIHSRCNIILGVIEKEGHTVELAKKYLSRSLHS